MITLDIPAVTPTLNKTIRMHWSKRRRLDKVWAQLVMVAKTEAGVPGRPNFARVKLLITRYAPRTIDDHDNLVGGMKPLQDALVKNGLILDDTSEVIQTVTWSQMPAKEKRTIILIDPLSREN